ncbi:MAG: glutamate ligase domain-containing protein [Verrucomicrobiota bacterium]
MPPIDVSRIPGTAAGPRPTARDEGTPSARPKAFGPSTTGCETGGRRQRQSSLRQAPPTGRLRPTAAPDIAHAGGVGPGPAGHPLERLDLCRIPREGRVSAATAALLHGLLAHAGRRPALITPEGGRIADRLFPQRPVREEALEWARLLASHVRCGGDCLVVEEDAEIRALIGQASPRARLGTPTGIRVRVEALALHWKGTRLEVLGLPGTPPRTAHLPIVGGSTLKGLEAALEVALAAGCPIPRTLEALPLLEPPQGLLEPVQAGQPFGVFVDRAASPDDLRDLIAEARTLGGRRVLLVTGIRGNTGSAERAALGDAARGADEVVFTSDNPGHATVGDILADLQRGHGGASRGEPDRNLAIRTAVRDARADDVVLIAGKGGLPFQEVRGSVIPWDDRGHAREALAARGWVGDSL